MSSNLDDQHSHWETAFIKDPGMFGEEPSEPAKRAVDFFKSNGVSKLLELGGGQGRDTIYFAQNGFHVTVLEYTDAGIDAIRTKADSLGLAHLVNPIKHDVRRTLPFNDETFEACFSHMLYCMAFTTPELEALSGEVRRVLKPNRFNIYTVRNTNDAHYGAGIPRGEEMYEANGFIVHFFSHEKIKILAHGYSVIGVTEFDEGDLPRKLFEVIYKRL